LNGSTPGEPNAAFAALGERRAGALLVGGDAYFSTRRRPIGSLAACGGIPPMYANPELMTEGGLMGYGHETIEAYPRAGLYAARLLRGEKPADLPVDQATKFEFLINLKTAKVLGLAVPPTLLARADEVIE